jgi:hypothetical protein
MTREKAHRSAEPHDAGRFIVERVQTGVRIEKRILRVLKGLAEYHDMSLGDLLEGIVLHAFEGKSPFNPETLKRIAELKKVYDLDLDASASHRLQEQNADATVALPDRKKGASGDGRRIRAGGRAGQR